VPYAIYINRNYSRLSGTRFACPQVSGTACLILSRYPAASPLEVKSIIEQTAWPMGGPDSDVNGIDDFLGHGLLDAGAALGNAPGADSVFENMDFLVGVTASPLFADDVYIIVKCKLGCDEPPHVSYFVQATAENAVVNMEPLPAQANTFLGRFETTGFGLITIRVTGILGGLPLEPLDIDFTLFD